MNERKRQAYLEAMDIQTYFPRRQLPGAKPSPLYDFPAEESVVSAPSATIAAAPTTKAQNVTGLDAIEELRTRPAAARTATVTPIREAQTASPQSNPETVAPQEAEDSLRFNLRYYRISEKLAVLDEVPPQGSRQITEESTQLMKAILKALGQGGVENIPQVEEFSWPLASGYSMKNTPEVEAAKAISGFLQMRKETDGFSNLLVFAGQVEGVFLLDDEGKTSRDFESSKGYYITVTHSLASMLAVPTLKRDVWQHLQMLRKRLDSSN